MIYLIDNYDSFTYNLVDYFQKLSQQVIVKTPEETTVEMIKAISPTHLVISPGPKSPKEANIAVDMIRAFYQTLPILGICLGHQCLAYAFGAKIISAPKIIHGKTSWINHNKQRLFSDIPNPFKATRYHSLAVDCATLSQGFSIDAWTDNNTIMAISHRQYPLFGLQFHPEAILTEHGLALLENFLTALHSSY